MRHHERHRTAHIGWLRASVLGANDGLISTASLIVGVAASGTDQLTERDALAAHARDELGLSEITAARPLQAALSSAVAFAVGAALPVVVAALAPAAWLARFVTGSALILLTILGAVAARVGGASMGRGGFRVAFWGALAMAASALVGRLFGTQVT